MAPPQELVLEDEPRQFSKLQLLKKPLFPCQKIAPPDVYLAKLLEGGDLDSACRRLAVITYEDIGLANPSMGPKVNAAIESALMLGLPEARIPLSAIVIELALSPKSNSAIMAIDKAIDVASKVDYGDIPSYLKSPYTGYLYPHNYKNDYVKQQYLPDKIKNIKLYIPKENKNELMLKEIMDKLEKQ